MELGVRDARTGAALFVRGAGRAEGQAKSAIHRHNIRHVRYVRYVRHIGNFSVVQHVNRFDHVNIVNYFKQIQFSAHIKGHILAICTRVVRILGVVRNVELGVLKSAWHRGKFRIQTRRQQHRGQHQQRKPASRQQFPAQASCQQFPAQASRFLRQVHEVQGPQQGRAASV